MKVKVIKDIKFPMGWMIKKGQELEVRACPGLFLMNRPYQVIEGKYMGETIPFDHCILVEKTYSEQEWNEMENHYMKLIDDERRKNNEKSKVALPEEVFKAFESVNKRLRNVNASDDTIYDILLNIRIYGNGAQGDLRTLYDYSMKNPKQYINAIANGYKLENTNITEQVSDLIQEWLNTEYVEDEETDIYLFAERLTEFYKEKLTKTS